MSSSKVVSVAVNRFKFNFFFSIFGSAEDSEKFQKFNQLGRVWRLYKYVLYGKLPELDRLVIT